MNSHSVSFGLFSLYASIALLALNGLFSKLIPLDVSTMTQGRSVIAALVLFFVLILQGTSLRLSSLREFLGVYALGVLLAFHWLTYFHSMQVSTVAIGMLTLFCYPVITIVLEPMLNRHLPKIRDVIAAFAVFFGVFLLVASDVMEGDLSSGTVEGVVWGVLSAIAFSVRNTTQKHFFPNVNSISLMGHQTLVVSLLCIPFIDVHQYKVLSWQGWLWMGMLGCFSTALAHTCLSVSLKRLPAKSVALISCTMPVLGAFLAWMVLGEKPEFMVYIGGAIILLVAVYETVKQ